jgi:hypothetical protein
MKFNKNGLHQVLLDNDEVLMCDSVGDYCSLTTGQLYNPLYDEEGMLIGFLDVFPEYTF